MTHNRDRFHIRCLGLIALLLFAGCASADSYRPSNLGTTGLAVSVTRGWVNGTGAVVGSRTVITSAHVVVNVSGTIRVNGRRATLSHTVPSTHDRIAILELATGEKGFKPIEIFQIVPNRIPYQVWTLRGEHRFEDSKIVGGDSGSPVLDYSGYLMGVVDGRWVSTTDPIDRTKVFPNQRTTVNRLPSNWRDSN